MVTFPRMYLIAYNPTFWHVDDRHFGREDRRAVFDNAAEVGGEVRTSGLFRRFAAHHGLDHAFTNPCSGNEKGSVENKVGCHMLMFTKKWSE